MSTHDFPLNVIVSVVKNRLVAPWEDYRDFLDHVTGQHIPLWDVERARRFVAARLLAQNKELRQLPDPPEKTDSGNAAKYVRDCAKKCRYDHLPVSTSKSKYVVRTSAQALKENG